MIGALLKGDPQAVAGFAATKRILMLGLLTLILMAPLEMIRGLLWERQSRGYDVENEIASQWGGVQRIAGPYLALPYQVRIPQSNASPRIEKRFLYILPETLTIDGRLATERRHRSVYEVLVYDAELQLRGTLPALDPAALSVDPADILWSEASLGLGIADMGGVRDLTVMLGGKALAPVPGLPQGRLFESGAHVKLAGLSPAAGPREFSIKLAVNGTRAIDFLPMGRATEVKLAGDWPHPNFIGSFLPEDRKIGEAGFDGLWRVSALARNYPQAWRSDELDFASVAQDAFGVALAEPGDVYQQADRIGKYGILVIALSFATIFVFDVAKATRTHFVQYLMVGAAIAVFYLLLLALAEQMAFGLAYLLASAAVIALNGLYIGSTVSKAAGGVIGTLLAILHGFLYVLLQAETYSLLMGAVGLFVTLAVAMYVTRKVDWYALGVKPLQPAPGGGATG